MGDYSKIGGALLEAGGLNIAIGILCLILGFYYYSLLFSLGLIIVGIGVSIAITGYIIKNA